MSEQEVKQFEAILSLYAEVNQHQKEFYVARFADMGYASLKYIGKDGLVERAYLHRTPRDLYCFLEDRWEEALLYDYMDEHKILDKEMDVFLENAPKDLKRKIVQLHEHLCRSAEEILNN